MENIVAELANSYKTLPVLISVLIVSSILIEAFHLYHTYKPKDIKGTSVSLLSGALAFIPNFILNKFIFITLMFWLYSIRFFNLGFDWYIWVLAYITHDFMFYIIHLLGHKVRILWCMHGVHHTSEDMQLSSAMRGSVFDVTFVPLMYILPCLLGFHPFMMLVIDAISKFYGVYEHINEHYVGKQPFLEKIFITPSVHRVHHGKNPIYLDRNFGETFVIWDKLFNTFQTELKEEKPCYGVMKELDSKDLKQVQFQEFKDLWKDFKNAPTIMDKFKYLLMPPGWHHSKSSTLTAKMIRDEALKNLKQHS